MPSLLRPQVRDVRENMSLRQRSFQWFLEKSIEERSVEFGCVDGEAEKGGRSGGGGGNGAHLGLSFRQGQPRNRRSMRVSGAPRIQPPIFFPRLISAEELLSNQKWDSYPQYHHTGDVPASHQVRNHPQPSQFQYRTSKSLYDANTEPTSSLVEWRCACGYEPLKPEV